MFRNHMQTLYQSLHVLKFQLYISYIIILLYSINSHYARKPISLLSFDVNRKRLVHYGTHLGLIDNN